MVMDLLSSGEQELHSLAEEMKDELQKEEHEVELSEQVLQDLSDALEAFEDIKPDIDVLQNMERVNLQEYADEDGTISPAALADSHKQVEKIKKLERDLPGIEQEAQRIENDLKDVVQKLREKDELFNKIGKEEGDIEGKISEIENNQIPELEEAVKKAEHLQ